MNLAGNEMRIIDIIPTPPLLVWDMTYACPLRCVHCYSEAGRRKSRQLSGANLQRVGNAMIVGQPKAIVLSGGEPLLVKGLLPLVASMRQHGIEVILYTSGWFSLTAIVPEIMHLFSRVTVSLDGATADVHDRIRGRQGSFARAIAALTELDRAIERAREQGGHAPELGIDVTVMQSNWQQLSSICSSIASRFTSLSSLSFGAVIPTGLASRESFSQAELIQDNLFSLMIGREFVENLQASAPSRTRVTVTDIRKFQMHPDLIAAGIGIPPLQIEPDGQVRAMPIYEGTIGNVLDEPIEVLWGRAIERWSDSFVVSTLRNVNAMQDWASAARLLDLQFGSASDRDRISRRPVYGLQA
jgi:MoaA/NifB/PqqE/SkfB family radical SAM enzyme